MIQKLGLICLFMCFSISIYAQVEVPEFEYIIVPEKFEFQKTENTYEIYDLTKFLLKKNGFNAVFQKELNNFNQCESLFADLEIENGVIYTKAVLILRNCKGTEVVRTVTGKSKVKDYKKAYHEAIRNALKNFTKNALTIIPSEAQNVELPKPSESTTPIDLPKSGVAKVEVETKVSEENVIPVEVRKEDSRAISEEEVYTFESYTIVKNNGSFVVVFEEELIGALIPTSMNSVFLVKTTQFYGVAYKNAGSFLIEREVDGLKGLIPMVFKK